MKRPGILREPLLVFALLGGMIYVAYANLAFDDTHRIVITQAAVDDLVSERELVLDRPLTPKERRTLLGAFVDREILVREAIERGLYRKDAKIHSRLADKMYFLLEEEPPEPTAAQLQVQFEQNRQDYLSPHTVTFEHVFFKSGRANADRALAAIHDDSAEPDELGDRFWLGRRMERYSSKQLLVLLGFEFEQALRKLTPGEWHGPIRSGRGWHLVRIERRHEPHLLPENELQRRLTADWKAAWRDRQREQQLVSLRQRYAIVYPDHDS